MRLTISPQVRYTCMFATITINRFVLLIATGSGQGPTCICMARVCICFKTVVVAG